MQDFCVALWAEVERLTVGLLQAVAALHVALVLGAVLDREHVSCLMRCDLNRPRQTFLKSLITFSRIAKSI